MPQPTLATRDQCDQTQNVQSAQNPTILDLARANRSLQMQHDNDMRVLAGANHKIDVLRTEKSQLHIDLLKCRAELDKRNAALPAQQPKVCRHRLTATLYCFVGFMAFVTGFVIGSVQA